MSHSRHPVLAHVRHSQPACDSRPRERGFALFFVLVLILVLTVTGFLTSTSTRIDTQIVNTVKNERAAFYAAEAGIAEAHARLVLTGSATANPSGVGTFQASFTGTYAPDGADPLWNVEIVFTSAGTYPSKSGSNVVSPSIQPAASRLAYSTTAVGATDNLRIRWSRCTVVDPALGCSAVGAIRTIGGQNVLQIASTGRSGPARRQLLLDLVVNSRTSTVVLRSDACPGVRTQGSGAVNFPGSVVVNSTCATAMSAGGASSITAAGPISVVGGSTTGNISPTPTTGATAVLDPFATYPYPAVGWSRRGAGTQALPVKMQVSGTTTIFPGTYYGGIEFRANSNVTMNPGVYVIAGGGFTVASNAQVQSATGGVMIFNTCTPNALLTDCTTIPAGQFAPINVSANRPIVLRSMTQATAGNITLAGPGATTLWAGIIIFQHRLNAQPLYFTSGATGDVNGLIYAPIATVTVSGNADLLRSQLLVGAVDLQGGPVIGEPQVWLNIGGTSGTATAVAWADR